MALVCHFSTEASYYIVEVVLTHLTGLAPLNFFSKKKLSGKWASNTIFARLLLRKIGGNIQIFHTHYHEMMTETELSFLFFWSI